MFEQITPMLGELLRSVASAPGGRMSQDEMIAIYGKDGADYRAEKLLSLHCLDIVSVDPYVCQVSQ